METRPMRMMAVAAVSILLAGGLAGCATSGVEDAMDLEAPADDAHCQSLLIRPGELVYAQCRLALRKTYLNDYAARKAVIQQQYGPVSGELDIALRADAFCNYDESVKQVVTPGLSDDVVAETAYQNCANTRGELGAKFAEATGRPAELLAEAERPTVLGQNRKAIREARVVIKGPPGSTLVTESQVAIENAPGAQAAGTVVPPAPVAH
ncbi:hypothetical protein [Jiella sonneratiae]|uniref:Uncharacterized protein n=1 Tax=Jiella sonneratiae TaxID=2816856 RepID=A0ABS3J2S0_9HYPH|nr:hypothetical protein [Jiella sonneratiae]MBO0903958.1 hypothetical protein [Jiella sonneratiae]